MIVACALYEDGVRRPGHLDLRDACEAGRAPGAFVWIDLHAPTTDEFRALQDEFGLHPLAVEDAVEAHERPKLERYGDVSFLVLRTACYDDAREEVGFGEILLFAGDGFLITARHGQATELDAVRSALEADPERMRKGVAAAVHAVVDHVVDGYEPVVAGLQDDIDEVERALFSESAVDPTRRIYRLGRELLGLSRAVTPLVEPVGALADGGRLPGDRANGVSAYFRDVLDHVVRYDQWVGAQRQLISDLLQANLTRVTVGQNADMRKISAWVAIAAVPTMVAGVYGMNFEHMPELGWRFGYPLVVGAMALVCCLLYLRFKRSGWL